MLPLRWAGLFSLVCSLGLTGCGSESPDSNQQQAAARQVTQDRADRIEQLKTKAAARQKKARKDQPSPTKPAPAKPATAPKAS